MDNFEKIKKGLEESYKKLIDFKKYKRTPIIVSRDGKIIELSPEDITTEDNVYK
jgi:hypothetical protein